MHSHVHCSIIYNSQNMEMIQASINNEQINVCIYTPTQIYNEILFTCRKR